MIAFKQLHKISRRTGFEPIVAELFLLERIEQAERIVKTFTVVGEMITVIAGSQLITCLLIRHTLHTG